MKSSPVLGNDRIVSIDIIRGFALLGIFLVNMPAFHSPDFMMQMYGGGDAEHTGVDYWLDVFFALFIDMKFFTIFSFLFGLGFYIFMSRAEQKGLNMNLLYTRRVLALLVFGALHLVLLWFGDILHTYAITGLFLLLFYRRKIKTMVIWAGSLLLMLNALMALPLLIPSNLLEAVEGSQTSTYNEKLVEYLHIYEQAGYGEWVSYRLGAELVPILLNLIPAMIPVLAMFLLGLAAGKAGIFKPDTPHLGFIRKVRTMTLLISVPFVVLLALFKLEIIGAGVKNDTFVQLFTSLSGVSLCLFYISFLTLLLRNGQWQKRLRPLGYVGQMALTNYLSQTIISVGIFVGLGFYNDVSILVGTLMALGIYTLQVVFSYYWLKAFQFGPFEWLWRSITYGRFQSMKKKGDQTPAVEKKVL